MKIVRSLSSDGWSDPSWRGRTKRGAQNGCSGFPARRSSMPSRVGGAGKKKVFGGLLSISLVLNCSTHDVKCVESKPGTNDDGITQTNLAKGRLRG